MIEERQQFAGTWNALCASIFRECLTHDWVTRRVDLIPNLGFHDVSVNEVYVFDDAVGKEVVARTTLWGNKIASLYFSDRFEQFQLTFTKTPLRVVHVEARCVDRMSGVCKLFIMDALRIKD